LNLTTGHSWRKCLDDVRDESFKQSNYEAARLLRTETAYVAAEMEAEAYEEAEFEEYEFVATLDTRTSTICQEMDGKRFKLKDRETGKNYPPMHPFCRSTTVAVIDGFDISKMQRRARDPETDKTYKVPANMNYEEWYQKHVVDTGKEWSVKAHQNRHRDLQQYENYIGVLGNNRLPRSVSGFQKMKYNETKKRETLKREKATISSIDSKSWSDSYKEKVKKSYYDLRAENIEASWHGAQRFEQHGRSSGVTAKEVAERLRSKPDSIQGDGRELYKVGVLDVIRNPNSSEIVTVVNRRGKRNANQ